MNNRLLFGSSGGGRLVFSAETNANNLIYISRYSGTVSPQGSVVGNWDSTVFLNGVAGTYTFKLTDSLGNTAEATVTSPFELPEPTYDKPYTLQSLSIFCTKYANFGDGVFWYKEFLHAEGVMARIPIVGLNSYNYPIKAEIYEL